MARGYDRPPGWTTTTKRILNRDGRRCYLCGGPATQVDHIVRPGLGGTHEDHNLAAICQPCHDRKTKLEAADGRRRALALRKQQPSHPGLISRDG